MGRPLARLQLLAEGEGVDARADEDELAEALARGPGLRVEAQETADGVHGVPVAGVGGTEVDVALDAVETLGPAVEEVHQPPGTEGHFGGEGEGLVDGVQMAVMVAGAVMVMGAVVVMVAIRLGKAIVLTVLLPVQVVEGELPDALLRGPAVEEELGVDPPVRGGHDGGGAVGEGPDEGDHTVGIRRAVRLVDDDQIGDGEVPVDLGMLLAGGVELRGVDDLHEPAVDDARVLAGQEHLDQLLGLGQPTRLDDDDVDSGRGLSEPVQEDVELACVHGTAQTPVPQGDGGVAERPGHGHRIDLDGTEVIDDRPDTTASAAVQEVVEQGGLAGAQEAGEDDDRDLLGARLTQRATSLTPMRAPAHGPALTTGNECRTRIRAGGKPSE